MFKSAVRSVIPKPAMEWIDRVRWRTIDEPSIADRILPYIATYSIVGERGFYVECGANDGTNASNTLKLERMGWHGMLIEPSPSAFDTCKSTRKADNIFVNCALVSDPAVSSVDGDFDGHGMSSIGGHRNSRPANVKVPARTLQSLLDEHQVGGIDFFSLDVEGAELDVLKGLDLRRNPPTTVLIEVYERDRLAIFDLMARNGYPAPVNLSKFSKATHPRWDGTHDDYLFAHNAIAN